MADYEIVKGWHAFVKVGRRIVFHCYTRTEVAAREMLKEAALRYPDAETGVQPYRKRVTGEQSRAYEAILAIAPEETPFIRYS